MRDDQKPFYDGRQCVWDKQWTFKFFNYLPLFLVIFFLVGCATPAPVKQAIKNQSNGYNELQQTLNEFRRLYLELNATLLQLARESEIRTKALKMVVDNNSAEKWDGKDLQTKLAKLNLEAAKTSADQKQIMGSIENFKIAHKNASLEIDSLIILHDAVAEYLEIDLTPDSKTLQEAVTNLRALRE